MNKQMLATISGLLSFTIGIALAFVLGRHSDPSNLSEAPIRCSKYVYSVAPATQPQIGPSHDRALQEQFGEQPVLVSRHFDGMIFWSGTVTGRTNIVIRKSHLEFETISGTVRTGVERFSTMPVKPMRIRLSDTAGKVRIIQAPNPSNGFVTIVQVEGDHDLVSFALQWTILE